MPFEAVLIVVEFILPISPVVEYLVIDDTNLGDPLLVSSCIDENDMSRLGFGLEFGDWLAILDVGLVTG